MFSFNNSSFLVHHYVPSLCIVRYPFIFRFWFYTVQVILFLAALFMVPVNYQNEEITTLSLWKTYAIRISLLHQIITKSWRGVNIKTLLVFSWLFRLLSWSLISSREITYGRIKSIRIKMFSLKVPYRSSVNQTSHTVKWSRLQAMMHSWQVSR